MHIIAIVLPRNRAGEMMKTRCRVAPFIVSALMIRGFVLSSRDAIIRYYSGKAQCVRRAMSLRIFNPNKRRFTIMRDDKVPSFVENNERHSGILWRNNARGWRSRRGTEYAMEAANSAVRTSIGQAGWKGSTWDVCPIFGSVILAELEIVSNVKLEDRKFVCDPSGEFVNSLAFYPMRCFYRKTSSPRRMGG